MAEELTVETIKIEITGEANGGLEALDKVIGKLRDLKDAAKNSSLSTVSKNLDKLRDSVDKITNSTSEKLSKLADSIAKLKENRNINFGKTPERIKALADSVADMRDVDMTKLTQLADGLTALKNVGTVKTPRVTGSSGGGNTGTVGGATGGTVTFDSRKTTVNDAVRQNPYAKGGKYYNQKPDEDTKQSWEDLGSTVKSVFASIASTDSKAASLLAAVKPEAAIVVGLMSKTLGVIGKIVKGVGTLAKKVVTFPFKLIGAGIKSITSQVGNFMAMLKKRTLYRLINALISSVQKGFTEGLDNAYQYSKAFNGPLAQSLDRVATSFLYFKNSVGAAAAPLIVKLAPAIEYVTDRAVDLLNVFNQIFALLTGADTWTKALKYPTEYAEEANNATKAVKELKKSVLGIDELNQLKDNSSGGGGSGKTALDYSSMFEEASFTGKIKDFIDRLKEEAANGNYEEIGRILGQKVNESVQKFDSEIKWETVGDKIRGKIDSISAVFNSFGATVKWEDIGATVGDGFDTVLNTLDYALQKFHLSDTGTHLAEIINGFFKEVDPVTVGNTISDIILTGIDWATNFVKGLDKTDIGTKLAGIFKNIKKDEIAGAIKELLTSAFEGGLELLGSFIEQSGLENPLRVVLSALLSAVSGILAANGHPVLATLVNLFQAKNNLQIVKNAGKKAGEAGADGLIDGTESTLGKPGGRKRVRSTYEDTFLPGAFPTESAENTGETIADKIGGAIQNWLNTPSYTIEGKFIKWLAGVFNKTDAENAGTTVSDSFGSKILAWLEAPLAMFQTKFRGWLGSVFNKSDASATGADVGNATQGGVESTFSESGNVTIKGLFGGWLGASFPLLTASMTGSSVGGAIQTGVEGEFDTNSDGSTKVKNTFFDWIGAVFDKNKAKTQGENVGDNAVTGIKTKIEGSSLGDLIGKLFSKNNAKKAGEDLGTSLLEGIKTKFDKAKVTINTNFNNGVTGINPKLTFDTQGMATGGFVSTGQAFIAREAGPELVGTIGNRTAVVNNDQIVDSVSQGVYEANTESNALLREQNEILRAILGKDAGGGDMTADAILNTLGRWNRRVGAAVSPVG